MLQWTGGSRRKVATSRKSTHSRQKQYFEQRKRQRQAPGQENHANRSDMEVLYNAEPRSLDILNLINLAVASQQDSTELRVSKSYDCAKVSDDSLSGKDNGDSGVTEGTRLTQVKKSSNRDLPQVCQTDFYRSDSHVNKLKMQESILEHTSSYPVDTLNEKAEKPQTGATVFDLLDDEPYTNRRSVPEAHVALIAEGLGKIRSQTPCHSPRMQTRFSCKGIPMSSKLPKRVRSSSALHSSHNGLNGELNAMIDDFSLSPLCNNNVSWAYSGTKTTSHKSNVAPSPPYSLADQLEKISMNRKGFDACLIPPYENHQNDNFGHLERPFIEETYDSASQNQRLPFEEYHFRNSCTKMFEIYETSDAKVKDTFEGSRHLWEGGKKFEASATSAPHFRRPTLDEEINPSFTWDSDGVNADEIFNSPAWNFLPTEDFQDNLSLLSENSNSSSPVRNKTSPSFGSRSMKLGKGKSDPNEVLKFSDGGKFINICSQDENIFTGFDDTVWEKLGSDNTFFPAQIFPSKAASTLDPFDSFRIRRKTTTSPVFKAMNQDDPFDQFPTPMSKFEIPFEYEPTSDLFSKQSVSDLNSHIPIKPSSKARGHGQYSHSTHLPKYQEYNEDRGSSGKPHPKDAEKKSPSSGNAESAAGAESLGKVESKIEIPEVSDSPRVEKSNEEAEEIPTLLENFPSQIQNYVRSKLNQFHGHSPASSHPRNEESKETFETKSNKFQSEGGGEGDASYQVMLQSYVLQLLCVQKVLLEASGKEVKKV